jgi:dimethylhistidine N-methyltransferase
LETADLAAEVLAGLQAQPKSLPSKLFYDARGSELFNAITRTEAYYPTRLERSIFSGHSASIAQLCGDHRVLVELGPGDMSKVRLLLSALKPTTYVAIDVSEQQLVDAGSALAREYPGLQVLALCSDFRSVGPRLDELTGQAPRTAFFPGSTIGNFEPEEAGAFLADLRMLAGKGGTAIIGVDLQKPKAVLDAAYNDPEGWTRAFNLNMLAHVNRELGANFDERRFAHRAFYNEAKQRLEMHLVSMVAQDVDVCGHIIRFQPGETIHTENSYKYRCEDFERLASRAGWSTLGRLTDPQGWFAVFVLSAA